MDAARRQQAIGVMTAWLRRIGVTDQAQAAKGAAAFVDRAIAEGAGGQRDGQPGNS
jgi:hypothetical protein